MFILMAIIMLCIGILLACKASKMPKEKGLSIMVGLCAIIIIALGVALFYGVLLGKIKLPLY